MADVTATDGTGGGVRRHFDGGKLLNGGGNGFDVVPVVAVSPGRLAFGESPTPNEVYDNA
jgi:hypothetical protein